jgi:RNA polymerase sigma-70 factor (ECF subfamily)
MGVTSVPRLAPLVQDDADLVELAAKGNERAFATLYKRHARYVAGVVYRLMGNDAELDDVMQETFCDAARALCNLRDPEGLRFWLARIAVRRVHKRLSARRRWRWLVGTNHDEIAPKVSEPHARQRVDNLYEGLENLPLKLRTPWVLHMIEGQTLPEAAATCDVSLATVKRRIAEADERLDRWLHET